MTTSPGFPRTGHVSRNEGLFEGHVFAGVDPLCCVAIVIVVLVRLFLYIPGHRHTFPSRVSILSRTVPSPISQYKPTTLYPTLSGFPSWCVSGRGQGY